MADDDDYDADDYDDDDDMRPLLLLDADEVESAVLERRGVGVEASPVPSAAAAAKKAVYVVPPPGSI